MWFPTDTRGRLDLNCVHHGIEFFKPLHVSSVSAIPDHSLESDGPQNNDNNNNKESISAPEGGQVQQYSSLFIAPAVVSTK